MKKIAAVMFVICAFVLVGSLNLYASGGGGGGGADSTQSVGMIQPTGYSSVPQTNISEGTLNIDDITPPRTEEELKQLIKDDIIRDAARSEIQSAVWRAVGHLMDTGELSSKVVVVGAGIGLAIGLAPGTVIGFAGAEAAVGTVTVLGSLTAGAGYSVITTVVQGGSASDAAKAGIQTTAISILLPKSHAVITGLIDAGISSLPAPTSSPVYGGVSKN
jgi:hypothetical protein